MKKVLLASLLVLGLVVPCFAEMYLRVDKLDLGFNHGEAIKIDDSRISGDLEYLAQSFLWLRMNENLMVPHRFFRLVPLDISIETQKADCGMDRDIVKYITFTDTETGEKFIIKR